jgi:hypothetical protein
MAWRHALIQQGGRAAVEIAACVVHRHYHTDSEQVCILPWSRLLTDAGEGSGP